MLTNQSILYSNERGASFNGRRPVIRGNSNQITAIRNKPASEGPISVSAKLITERRNNPRNNMGEKCLEDFFPQPFPNSQKQSTRS